MLTENRSFGQIMSQHNQQGNDGGQNQTKA